MSSAPSTARVVSAAAPRVRAERERFNLAQT